MDIRRKRFWSSKKRWIAVIIVFIPLCCYLFIDGGPNWPQRAHFGRRRDNGIWYNFSFPPSLLFFAYTAFVDLRTFASSPAGTPVIRVIAISTKFEDQRKRNITVLCVPLHRSSSYRVKTTWWPESNRSRISTELFSTVDFTIDTLDWSHGLSAGPFFLRSSVLF